MRHCFFSLNSIFPRLSYLSRWRIPFAVIVRVVSIGFLAVHLFEFLRRVFVFVVLFHWAFLEVKRKLRREFQRREVLVVELLIVVETVGRSEQFGIAC